MTVKLSTVSQWSHIYSAVLEAAGVIQVFQQKGVPVQSIESKITPGQTTLCVVSGQLLGSVQYTI